MRILYTQQIQYTVIAAGGGPFAGPTKRGLMMSGDRGDM
jgi:hypothetical protein